MAHMRILLAAATVATISLMSCGYAFTAVNRANTTSLPAGVTGGPFLEQACHDICLAHLDEALSPDGRWMVHPQDVVTLSSTLRIVSTAQPALTLTITLSAAPGGSLFVVSWAPDSTTLVLYGYAANAQYAPIDRIVMVRLDARRATLSHHVYTLTELSNGRGWSAAWSPDGTRFGISLYPHEIMIFDRFARPVKQIRPALKATDQLGDFLWTRAGFFYDVTDSTDVRREKPTALHRMQVEDASSDHVLYQDMGYLTPLSVDSAGGRLLLERKDTSPGAPSELLVINLNSGRREKTLSLPGSFSRFSVANPWVAFEVPLSRKLTSKLLVFDWRNGDLVDYGDIVDLVGWRTNVQGFMVVQGQEQDPWNEQDTWKLAIVKPSNLLRMRKAELQ